MAPIPPPRRLQWSGGASAVSGTLTSSSDIEFYIDTHPTTGREMVVISDAVTTRHQVRISISFSISIRCALALGAH